MTSAYSETAAERGVRQLGVVWQGPQLQKHSYAFVNRSICQGLIARGHELTILPFEPDDPLTDFSTLPGPLRDCVGRIPTLRPDVHVRSQWPPELGPVVVARSVWIQPWEWGSMPRAWLEPMRDVVDEIWVPTEYVRGCYVDAGVPTEKIQTIPNGVDPKLFHPDATPFALKTDRRHKFLFVGGTIERKGIRQLLEAYRKEFSARDDVCLVIKDFGRESFYKRQTQHERIAEMQRDPDAPEIEYLDATLSSAQLAGLYTACDVLVHPYLGEGR